MHVTRTFPGPRMSSANFVLVSRHGLLVTSGENAIVAFDRRTGRRRWTVDLRGGTYEDPCPFVAIADTARTLYCGSYFGQIEERNLMTGDRTGRTLDPQIGSVGDLAVSADGRELIAFAAQSGVVSRWRLDGSGPVTRLVGRGRIATDGYATGLLPTSSRARLMAGVVPAAAALLDPDRDRIVTRVPGAADLGWVGSGLLGAQWSDGSAKVYDVARARRVLPTPFRNQVEGVWRSPDETRLFLATKHGTDLPGPFEVRAYDATTLAPLGHAAKLRAYAVNSVSMTHGGGRLVVTIDTGKKFVTHVFDAGTGRRVATGLVGQELTLLSPADDLVAVSVRGQLALYDLATLRPKATFAGARGLVSSLQFSSDSSTLVVTSPDQAVQIYDVASRLRLGDALVSDSPRTEGWLRPDGQAVAVNQGQGIAVWNIDAKHLLTAACALAGRELTRTEWATYVGGGRSYRPTCPRAS